MTSASSEPDEGVYDAQNKGIRRARGTFCLFLNAGDALASEEALARVLAGPPAEDVVYGDVVFEEADGRRRRPERMPDAITLEFLMRTNLPHQATLVRRALFDRLGPYDATLRIAADYEFFLRAIVVHGATTRHVPVPLAVQVLGGLSSRPESFAKLRAERKLARERALSPVLRAHWEEYVAARDGVVGHFVRGAFRPAARRLRALTRALRHPLAPRPLSSDPVRPLGSIAGPNLARMLLMDVGTPTSADPASTPRTLNVPAAMLSSPFARSQGLGVGTERRSSAPSRSLGLESVGVLLDEVRHVLDHVSGVLADFKPQLKPHGSFGHASHHGLKRFLCAVPLVFGVIVRVDSAELVGGYKRAVRHHSDAVQNVANT